MSKQRVRIIGKRKFNEETKTVSFRVPLSKYDDIKNLITLLVNNILKEKQIRIQVQRKNGIIRNILDEIGNPNEEEIQPSQEIIDLENGFREFLEIYNKIREKTNTQISGLLNAEGLAEILNELNFDLIKRVVKNLNNPNNSTKKGNPNNLGNPDNSDKKMDIKTLENIENLIWKDILQEDKENFTPEFREKVRETIEKIEIMIKTNKYTNMLESFDLLNDLDKLETWLSYLTEQEREKLYSHELLDEYDFLP